MMNQARLELLNTLEELSGLYPEMRLGQWVANLAPNALCSTAEAIWDVEDEELSAAAREAVQNFRDMRPERAARWQQESEGPSTLVSPPRRELLDVIRDLSACRDWRFGQLIANLATAARLPTVRHGFPEAVWDVEDEEMLPAARSLLEYFRTTRPERFAEPMATTAD